MSKRNKKASEFFSGIETKFKERFRRKRSGNIEEFSPLYKNYNLNKPLIPEKEACIEEVKSAEMFSEGKKDFKSKDVHKERLVEMIKKRGSKKEEKKNKSETDITENNIEEDKVLSFYEEELNRKFGRAENDKTENKQVFCDVNVSECGGKNPPVPPKVKDNFEQDADKEPKSMPGDEEKKNENDTEKSEDSPMQNIFAEVHDHADTTAISPPISEKEKKYEFPSIDLLANPTRATGLNERELKETAAKIQNTLQSFGVSVTVTGINYGPFVTQYEIQPCQGVKISQITKLSDDIKLSLAAKDIHIEAPIPGKAAVGIEVPNKKSTPVILRELLESTEFRNNKSRLAFALGRKVNGQIVVSDIANMQNLLIAGTTGSGKSVFINNIIMSILYKSDPKDVKFLMISPDPSGLSVYNWIPHMLIPVVTAPQKASAALNWAVAEMTERYQKFSELSVRDLRGYNEKIAMFDEPNPAFFRFPQIVIIIDDLADLMISSFSKSIEDAICILSGKASNTGIHLIIATQRPSVDVITGRIKANIPSRISFSVFSTIDSMVILDEKGAEKLCRNGDMLLKQRGNMNLEKIHGAYVSDEEIFSVVDFLREQTEYYEQITEKANRKEEKDSGITADGIFARAGIQPEWDELLIDAGRLVIEKQKVSIGMLQRVYKIGFNRAARIMDGLYEAGVVGGESGTKPREILMTSEEFERRFGI